MKKLFPDDMHLVHHSFREEERCFLSLAASACFSLQPDTPRMLHIQAMWPAIEAALGRDEIFDFGMPKPRGEFLVYGEAWSTSPVTAQEVRVGVGDLLKSLYVFGNRHWSPGGLPSEPEPYTSIPIRHEHAFGGPDVPENPVGKGFYPDASGRRPLPNIQDPANLMSGPDDRPFPAGLTAWPMTSPQRMRYMGTVDESYLLESWPSFPRGTLPEYFNTAPEDQRIQGFFQGDEVVTILNMHPTKPRIVSSLPGVRARLFSHRKDSGQVVFAEIPCRAETVWLFPDQERGILLYRGVAEVEDEEYDDVLHLFARWESLSEEPKDPEYYHRLFRDEIDAKEAPKQVPDDEAPEIQREEPTSPLGAAGFAGTESEAVHPDLENLMKEGEKLQAEAMDMLKDAGLDPMEVFAKLPTAEPDLESVGLDDIENLMADLEKQTKGLLAKFNVNAEDALKFLEQKTEEQSMPLEEVIERLRAAGIDNPEIDARFREADLHLKEAEANISALENEARKDTEMLEKSPLPSSQPSVEAPSAKSQDASPSTVDDVLAVYEKGGSLAGKDLTGLDFSGRDLSGADFTEAVLDRCVFRGTNLSKAVFTGAILTNANLEGADLHEADLREAHAFGAGMQEANLEEADLSQGDFTGTNQTGAKMNRANLTDAIFEQAEMAGVKAQEIQAARAGFMAANLTAVDLAGAGLEEADFSLANLNGADLTGIKAPGLRLHGAMCAEAVFKDAMLNASRSDQEASFAGANLNGADLCRSCWDGVDLSGADLTGAVLDNADFSRTNLTRATLRQASARETNFMKADFTGTDLSRINLFKGVLRKAILVNATLRSSNLYGVDFYKARIGNTDLEKANLKRTLLGMGISR